MRPKGLRQRKEEPIAKRVLLTGFEPFGGEECNASGEAVRLVGERGLPGLHVAWGILPVTFSGAPRRLNALIGRHEPDVVLCVGEAGGRTAITPERWAANLADARIPDNDGVQPRGEPLDDGPEALPSRLDVDAMVAALRSAGLPAKASEDAGRYVCNATFRAALRGFDGPAGFVHIPAVRPEGQAGVGDETDGAAGLDSGLRLEDVGRALGVIIGAAVPSPRH